jgi:hypothetical protein
MKSVTLDKDFLVRDITNFTSNFTWRNQCFVSIEWYWGCCVLLDWWPTFAPLEKITFLKLGVMFREIYDTNIFQVWYPSIDIRFILTRVKFEDGLTISVLKTKATFYKNLQPEIIKFLKKSNLFNDRPPNFISHTPFFFSNAPKVAICQDLARRCMSELLRQLEHIQKSKLWLWFSNRFYLLNETWFG